MTAQITTHTITPTIMHAITKMISNVLSNMIANKVTTAVTNTATSLTANATSNTSGLLFAFAFVLAFTSNVKAADNATLILSGVVPQVYSIDVQAKPDAVNLNVTGGESRLLVATVREQSNVPSGYTIQVTSANNGTLAHETIANETLPYQVTYDGQPPVRLAATPVEVKNSGALTTPADHVSTLEITFPAKRAAMAGTYADTLTFEISAP